ncbi:Wzz/FepE/Etk N-terminal domain-containing protein [Streptomyces sp. NPDC051576]|uniref:Wzz/FepE/Etk N-terminal domain-containing protein n=1 Tax=Streptomyces sp. NPDC051576 TaxID=3155803 RepID=UPI003432E820
MDLRDYISTLRRRWRFIVVCVLLGLAGAVGVTALMPRTYTANAQLFIATSDKDSAVAYQGGLFAQQRVKSYTRIVTSTTVLGGVISDLGLHTSPARLAQKITAQAPLDTTLIDIKVNDPSAARAQAIADQTAVQFTRYIATIEDSSAGSPPLVKASVVGGSEPPTTPTSPRPALNLALGLLAGIVVGVGGAVLRQSLDTTLRSATDIDTHLGLRTVGAVPPPEHGRPGAGRRGGAARRTEAVSRLRTRLRFGDGDRMPNSVLIAGALPKEGRTRTAIDLATSVARTGRRVVLVEADLRRPRLAKDLGLRGTPGLTGVLVDGTPLHDALEDWEDGGISVLPSGPPAEDPSTLLSSPDTARLIRTLEARADLVVVDSPPLLPFADGAALASVTEGVLFVVRAGKTRRDAAVRALDDLSAVHVRVLGAVLTGTRAEEPPGRQPPGHPQHQDLSPREQFRPDHAWKPDDRTWSAPAVSPSPDRHRA